MHKPYKMDKNVRELILDVLFRARFKVAALQVNHEKVGLDTPKVIGVCG